MTIDKQADDYEGPQSAGFFRVNEVTWGPGGAGGGGLAPHHHTPTTTAPTAAAASSAYLVDL